MTATSAVTLIAWALLAGRLVVLGTRRARSRTPSRDEWRPRVTSGCGR